MQLLCSRNHTSVSLNLLCPQSQLSIPQGRPRLLAIPARCVMTATQLYSRATRLRPRPDALYGHSQAGTCTTRSTHQFTKRAYEKGIVLIECPGCKTRHLIADNLGWFKESTEDGKLRNVEDLLRTRGEAVRRGRLNPDGSIEVNE
ncbi:DNL zinc finger-domain-containing protein [Russula compacta]|nr:DNL zinc finger-domain-containing protein [Russula compacta]